LSLTSLLVLVIKTQDLFVRGQIEQMENTSETGTKLGLLDKIKAKVGMGDAGDGVPDSTGVGHHHTTEPITAAAGAGGGARHRSESSPYDSAGVAPTSGTTNPPGSSGITDAANSSAPSATSTGAHGYDQRSESSPYDSSGAAPSAAESVTTTSHPGPAHEPTTTTADSYGQEHVRTESSPYDTAGANPEYLTKNQAGVGAGTTTFTDSQGNLQEGPREDNVKKEGLMSKIMDKLHHNSSTTKP
jgi:hypothetical protein